MTFPETSARACLPNECRQCGEPWPWKIRQYVNRGGHTTYPYVCGACGHKTAVLEKKAAIMEWLKGKPYSTNDIPKIRSDQSAPVCEICGKEGAELHHYAPQHLFENADDWPVGYLCIEHHREWHDKIRGHK